MYLLAVYFWPTRCRPSTASRCDSHWNVVTVCRIQIAVNLFVDLDRQQLNVYLEENARLPSRSISFPLLAPEQVRRFHSSQLTRMWKSSAEWSSCGERGRMLCFPADATCQAAERKWDSRCNFGWPVEHKRRQAWRNGEITQLRGGGTARHGTSLKC